MELGRTLAVITCFMMSAFNLNAQVPCTSGNYATAPVVPANAYPYTSPATGITVTATLGGGIGTLNNFQYACNGIPYNGVNPVWWLNNAAQSITLNFSQPVCSFSVIVNGTGNTEEFYFAPSGSLNNNCLGASGLCTNGWVVINGGAGMLYNGGGASSNLLVIQNPSGASTYVLTHNGLAAGSRYALVDCFQPCTPSTSCTLPIELLSFKGESHDGYNKLAWTTATEINNDYFILEVSPNIADGFEEIGTLDGAGNSNIELSYSFMDNNPRNGINYYRLKQVDFDGEYSYSDVVALNSNKGDNIIMYPNPSTGKLFLDIKGLRDERYKILCSNVLGSQFEEELYIKRGDATYELDRFSSLNRGIYFIQILDENDELIKTQKIVKQ
ncbi:MAG: T9SS type A sorting domain-containing protein [Vicingaceae bacterium]|nr:T9SS type A sorting domain-containing protein [Vicingaceae bacterium]